MVSTGEITGLGTHRHRTFWTIRGSKWRKRAKPDTLMTQNGSWSWTGHGPDPGYAVSRLFRGSGSGPVWTLHMTTPPGSETRNVPIWAISRVCRRWSKRGSKGMALIWNTRWPNTHNDLRIHMANLVFWTSDLAKQSILDWVESGPKWSKQGPRTHQPWDSQTA